MRGRIHVSSVVVSCLGVALVLEFTGLVQAADAPSQLPLMAPATIASRYDWTGFYIGGHVGYSWGDTSNTLYDRGPTGSSHSFGSLYGGMQIGYNYVSPSRLLVGIESDVSFP